MKVFWRFFKGVFQYSFPFSLLYFYVLWSSWSSTPSHHWCSGPVVVALPGLGWQWKNNMAKTYILYQCFSLFLFVFCPGARGLRFPKHLWGKGIVHRDIKAPNCLLLLPGGLDERQAVKVSDLPRHVVLHGFASLSGSQEMSVFSFSLFRPVQLAGCIPKAAKSANI